jgi:hypothetical protein
MTDNRLKHKNSDSPLSFGPPPAQRSHIGLDPGLVDKDQTLRIEVFLQGLPALSPARDVSAGSFERKQRFF